MGRTSYQSWIQPGCIVQMASRLRILVVGRIECTYEPAMTQGVLTW